MNPMAEYEAERERYKFMFCRETKQLERSLIISVTSLATSIIAVLFIFGSVSFPFNTISMVILGLWNGFLLRHLRDTYHLYTAATYVSYVRMLDAARQTEVDL